MIVALDSSTLDADGGLRAAQSYLDAVWSTLPRRIELSVLTFASSVAVLDTSTSNGRAPALTTVGDSRAAGSMLRHLIAIYRSEAHLAPRDLVIVLAGTPTDSYTRELRELGQLQTCGLNLLGQVSLTAIGDASAVHARAFHRALEPSVLHYEHSWRSTVKHLERSRR